MPNHAHGTATHGKTKNTNKAKNTCTLKQIICCCCFYMTHIEFSKFEVLISRIFCAFFSKPPDLHVMRVGRSGIHVFQLRNDEQIHANNRYLLYMSPLCVNMLERSNLLPACSRQVENNTPPRGCALLSKFL